MCAKSLLVVAIGMFIFGCAGSMPVPQEDLKYEKVYEIPGSTKDVIYQKSIQFLVHEFVSAKDVIQSQDKESGTILGKGNMRVTMMGVTQNKPLDFSIEIDCKDGKVRIAFENLGVNCKTFNDQAHANFESTAEDLKAYLFKEDKNW
jgi:Domain of unknown function (DUF4468) with TBP-like fold